jgi:hypothetical protein
MGVLETWKFVKGYSLWMLSMWFIGNHSDNYNKSIGLLNSECKSVSAQTTIPWIFHPDKRCPQIHAEGPQESAWKLFGLGVRVLSLNEYNHSLLSLYANYAKCTTIIVITSLPHSIWDKWKFNSAQRERLVKKLVKPATQLTVSTLLHYTSEAVPYRSMYKTLQNI